MAGPVRDASRVPGYIPAVRTPPLRTERLRSRPDISDSPPNFPDHFSDQSRRYAAHRPTYPGALADVLAGVAPARELAWDAGCGSGQLSVLLASRVRRVVATDASGEQLARARRHPRVCYRRELAERSSLPGGAVDLATVGQAAHWFDLEGYVREVRRVCRPGAAVALVTYGMARTASGVDRVVDRFYGEVLDAHWPPERRHVEASYGSLPFPFPEVETPSLEMRESWTLDDLAGYVGTWSAVRALEAEEGEGAVRAFREDLARAWGDPSAERTVRWPLTLLVGRVG